MLYSYVSSFPIFPFVELLLNFFCLFVCFKKEAMGDCYKQNDFAWKHLKLPEINVQKF